MKKKKRDNTHMRLDGVTLTCSICESKKIVGPVDLDILHLEIKLWRLKHQRYSEDKCRYLYQEIPTP